MAAKSKVTTDHDEIVRWAKARKAEPVVVRGTTIIRLDLPGFAGAERLEGIPWDDWFEHFDEQNLALVMQEKTGRGVKSNFNKLISRESVDLTTGRLKAPPRRAVKRAKRAGLPKPRNLREARAQKRQVSAGAKKRTPTRAAARTGRAKTTTRTRTTGRGKTTASRTTTRTSPRGTTTKSRSRTRSTSSRSRRR